MCLHYITNRVPVSDPLYTEEHDAWKVFVPWHTTPARVSFIFHGYHEEHTTDSKVYRAVPWNKWLTAHETLLNPDLRFRNGESYFSGFHVFPREPDADWIAATMGMNTRCLPVRVRKVHTCGRQYDADLDVWVARQMFVPEPLGRKEG